jgi:eukaryotic-like serine/threonine-protein kinase
VNAEPAGSRLDVTLREFTSGQKVFNRYTLIRILGRGGMGVVWLAHDEVLDRDVALKFLPELIVHDRAILEDLKRETKRSLELTHKNIIRIHDFVHDVISGCISMEYIEGDTLSNLRADKPSKIFEPAELRPWLFQVCDALDYAHNHARIIHRDLKPSNLMINQRGDVKVADFGIARSLSDSVSRVTQTPGTSGTLVYMSPQQLDGERGTHLDDIYSLGAMIYELLTSKPPFYSGDINRQIHDRTPPSMTQRRSDLDIEGNAIPKNWQETVAACLAKDPAKRPQSVAEIANRLELASPQIRAVPEMPVKHSTKKTFLVVTAVTVCLAAAAAWYFGVRISSDKPSTRPLAMGSQPPKETVSTTAPTSTVMQSKENGTEEARLADEKKQQQLAEEKSKTGQPPARQELLTLKHSKTVYSVAFSPDGKRIVTGSHDGTAKVWDAQSGGELLTLNVSDDVLSVAFSPDGKRVVTAGRAATVWDAQHGKVMLNLKGHSWGVLSVAFSWDGKRILTGSADRTAKVWDAHSGKELLTLKGHSGWVQSVAFSPDGKRIVTGSDDHTAKVWDAQTGAELLALKGHSRSVGSVAFSPDGKRIATGSRDGTAKVWDAQSGKELLAFKANSVAFSPDGKRIATNWGLLVEMWDAQSGKEMFTLNVRHSGLIYSVAFSPDGMRIVTGSNDSTAKVWDATIDGN